MTFKLGSGDINQIYLGSTEIKRAYLGSTLIHDTTGGGGGTPPSFTGVDINSLPFPQAGNTGGFTTNWSNHTHGADDYFVVIIGPRATEKGLVTPDTGTWLTLPGAQSGSAAGDRAAEVYYRRAGSSSESDTVWTDSGSQRHSHTAFIVSGVSGVGTKISQPFASNTSGGSANIVCPGGLLPSDNTLVVGIAVGESSTDSWISGEANADLSNLTVQQNTGFDNRGLWVVTGTRETATTIADTTATANVAADQAAFNLIFESE